MPSNASLENGSLESARPAKRARTSQHASAGPPRKHPQSSGGSGSGSTCPPHPAYMFGLCIRCGEPKPEQDAAADATVAAAATEGPSVTVRHLHRQHMELSAAEAARLRDVGLSKLLAHGKLVLVLDLDHTLLNSARISDITPGQHAQLMALMAAQRGRSTAAGASATRQQQPAQKEAEQPLQGARQKAAKLLQARQQQQHQKQEQQEQEEEQQPQQQQQQDQPQLMSAQQQKDTDAQGQQVSSEPGIDTGCSERGQQEQPVKPLDKGCEAEGSRQAAVVSDATEAPDSLCWDQGNAADPASAAQRAVGDIAAPPPVTSSSDQGSVADPEGGARRPLLFHLQDKGLWTKLRPFVFEFLEGEWKRSARCKHVHIQSLQCVHTSMVACCCSGTTGQRQCMLQVQPFTS